MKCSSVYLKPVSFKLHLIPVGVEVEGPHVLISPGVSKSKKIHRIHVPNLLLLLQILLLSTF